MVCRLASPCGRGLISGPFKYVIHMYVCTTTTTAGVGDYVRSTLFMSPANVMLGRRHTVFVLFVHACMRDSKHPETLLTRLSCTVFAHFHQTYTNNALSDRDKRIIIWGQKVIGYGGIKYAANSTFWAC